MAAFLRKKFATDSKSGVRQGAASSDYNQPSTTAPVFAKFATTYQGKSTSNASSKVVSSPMPLSNVNSRRRAEPVVEYAHARRQQAPGDGVMGANGRDGDARVLGRSAHPPAASGSLANPPVAFAPSTHPIPRQSKGSNVGAQPRNDRPPDATPGPISRNVVDKPLPLPNPNGADPLNSPPSVPTNRRTSTFFTPPPGASISTPHVQTYTEKPLPQPQKTPPPKPPASRPQDRDAEYFPPTHFRDQHPDNNDTEGDWLPSVPIKYGPTFSLIAPGVPQPAKNLPPQPQESPPLSVTTVPKPPVTTPSPPPPIHQRHAAEQSSDKPNRETGQGDKVARRSPSRSRQSPPVAIATPHHPESSPLTSAGPSSPYTRPSTTPNVRTQSLFFISLRLAAKSNAQSAHKRD